MTPDLHEKARDIIIKTIPFAQWQSYESLIGAIATALQNERNAALEKAAKVADGIAHYEDDPQGYALQVARAIRKLKGDAS